MIENLDFESEIYFEKLKPVAILTNTLNENLMEVGNRLYADRKFKKHILSKPATIKRLLDFSPKVKEEFAQFNTSLDPVEGLNLRKAIEHLQENYAYKMILVEAGASTVVPCYSESHRVSTRKVPKIDYLCDGNPIDTIYLAIYEGDLYEGVNSEGEAEPSPFIGQPFLNMSWLLSQYNLLEVGEPIKDVANFDGVCR